jgi:hypothetical protein
MAAQIRECATVEWNSLQLPEYRDSKQSLLHFKTCYNITKWFGREGGIPDETKLYLPLPAHPQTITGTSNICSGCAMQAWVSCLRHAAASH